MTEQIIYFDNNATTKIDKNALQKMQEIYQYPYNASSIHSLGRRAYDYLKKAQDKIKKSLNCQNNYRIIFTSGGTEGNNTILNAFKGQYILVSAIEHSSILKISDNFNVIGVDENGLVNLNELEEKLSKYQDSNLKILVSVMLANNETGVIEPIKEISIICKKYGALLHSDSSQAIGKLEVDIEDLDIDFLTISSHKFKGPSGVGAIIAKSKIEPFPYILGGGQQSGYRAGTENLPAIVGMAEALQIATENLKKRSEYILDLRNYLEEELKKIDSNIVIFSNKVERLVNTSLIVMKNVNQEAQLINFDLNNIALSAGSACSSGKVEASHVLKAMGAEGENLHNAIRVSLSYENNKEQIDKFIAIWKEIYERNKS